MLLADNSGPPAGQSENLGILPGGYFDTLLNKPGPCSMCGAEKPGELPCPWPNFCGRD